MDANAKLKQIVDTLNAGMRVQVSTYLKSTIYDKRHVGMFKVIGNDLFAQHGKRWICINYCSIKFERVA